MICPIARIPKSGKAQQSPSSPSRFPQSPLDCICDCPSILTRFISAMLRNSAALGLPLVLLAACLLTQVATFSTVPITLRKSSSLDASPLASLYRRGFQPSLHRDARRAPALKMQWKEGAEQLPFQPKWEAFQAYNMGRWKGKSLHISPFTGDYIEPFSSDHVLDIVELEDGVQTATERMTLGDDTGEFSAYSRYLPSPALT
eukprot:1084559-Rhodomonas_salina.1